MKKFFCNHTQKLIMSLTATCFCIEKLAEKVIIGTLITANKFSEAEIFRYGLLAFDILIFMPCLAMCVKRVFNPTSEISFFKALKWSIVTHILLFLSLFPCVICFEVKDILLNESVSKPSLAIISWYIFLLGLLLCLLPLKVLKFSVKSGLAVKNQNTEGAGIGTNII